MFYSLISTLKCTHMQLHSFAKILVIEPIAELYGESNERQLCTEIALIPPIGKVRHGENAKLTNRDITATSRTFRLSLIVQELAELLLCISRPNTLLVPFCWELAGDTRNDRLTCTIWGNYVFKTGSKCSSLSLEVQKLKWGMVTFLHLVHSV